MATVLAPDAARTNLLRERFRFLADRWRHECAAKSSTQELVLHSAYQQIIGLGPDAVPLLLEEMRERPDHWSWALRAITGEDPVKPEHKGKIARTAEDWVRWGELHGYVQAVQ